LANGSPVAGLVDVEVHANNHRSADRFVAAVALSADPTALAFWAASPEVSVEIQMSLDGATFASVFQGTVDLVEIDPVEGLLRAEGRDLTATLIETRTQETFANRTSSEIAALFAAEHNMNSAITPTTTPVGRYYQSEHDRITLDQFSRATTEWDLLAFLAQQEGFDVFVQANTLHFQPPSGPDGAFVLTPNDTTDLRLERALTLARDIEVTVKSWNSRQQSAFTQTARAHARGGRALGAGSGSPQRYVYVRPNLTSDQALKLAQQKLAELTRHHRTFSAVMPGELALTPRSVVTLAGTGSDFDQAYFVDSIERRLHVEAGFTQRIRCNNMDSGHQATPPADIVAAVTG
jgi:phage protein D